MPTFWAGRESERERERERESERERGGEIKSGPAVCCTLRSGSSAASLCERKTSEREMGRRERERERKRER
jgi:hypothetical protein